jgi:L-gulono-1,4-lactone dehydrogenase
VLTAVTFRGFPRSCSGPAGADALAEVIARLDELTSGNEHFEFFWFPHTEGCLTQAEQHQRRAAPAAGPAPLSA